ncbi:hypothetical protein CDO73_06625 [Saccharibacillus sp. O23]|uniref:hypothetical protein n=1 Tax=Saccharibacillus sp. O23 TaxID=2009338 RepID=UPI000B4E617B|nr:hypothetical protein [Saccharibacillus sp. O23]OWR31399.1 hypothetical protein CDO73_06625 [Saccharibacillus sp. O23]
MSDLSVLSLRKQQRKGYPCTFEYAGFVIDGNLLYDRILEIDPEADHAACLGMGPEDFQRREIERLLLNSEADFPNDRRSLYICPGCGDLECGAISLRIDRKDGMFVWHDFAFESIDYPPSKPKPLPHIGPFYFEAEAYEQTIRSAYGLGGFHWPTLQPDDDEEGES